MAGIFCSRERPARNPGAFFRQPDGTPWTRLRRPDRDARVCARKPARNSRAISGRLTALLAVVACVVAAAPAAAQPPRGGSFAAPPRVTVAVSGGYQPTTTEFDDEFTFELYRETGRTEVSYPIEAGFLFDAGVGIRLWRGLGAGVAVSRFVKDGAVSTTTSLPHPLFLQQNREITGDADGITREETGVHIQAQYLLPLSANLQVTLMGGPSILQVNQALVTDVNYSEEYPYDTASFTGVDSRDVKESATGFNAGADVRWMFSRHVGVGALVRFTRATVDLDAPGNRTISVDAGGTHVGAGVRIVF
jgi:opacity protein-like surface antigen